MLPDPSNSGEIRAWDPTAGDGLGQYGGAIDENPLPWELLTARRWGRRRAARLVGALVAEHDCTGAVMRRCGLFRWQVSWTLRITP